MAQVSLYMNENVMATLRENSKREGLSISRYIADLIDTHIHGHEDAWPTGYWDSTYGCIDDAIAQVMLEQTDALGDNAPGTPVLDPSLDDDCSWL